VGSDRLEEGVVRFVLLSRELAGQVVKENFNGLDLLEVYIQLQPANSLVRFEALYLKVKVLGTSGQAEQVYHYVGDRTR